jgi:hypothetical protein
MKNTYETKTDAFGVDYLEMTTPDGVISFVPMVAGNADYEAYLNKDTLPSNSSDFSQPIGGNE